MKSRKNSSAKLDTYTSIIFKTILQYQVREKYQIYPKSKQHH